MMLDKVKNFLSKNVAVFVFILLFVTLVFGGTLKTFFQQDEWHSFSWMITRQAAGFFAVILQPFLTSWRPLAQLFLHLEFAFFGLNSGSYFVVSILLHSINAFLVFLLAQKLTKQRSVAILSAIFFALCAVSAQAVTWVSSQADLLATVFGLLATIYFLDFLGSRMRKKYYLAILLLLVSLLFKDSTTFLIGLFFVLGYIKDQISFKQLPGIIKKYVLILLLGIVFILPKILPMFGQKSTGNFIGGNSSGFLFSVFSNLIFYPLKAIVQIFIYPSIVFVWAEKLINAKYVILADSLAVRETIAADLVLVVLAFIFWLLVVLIYQRLVKNKNELKDIFSFAALFIVLSVLPYIFLSQGAYLESRYYYLTAVGGALLFSTTAYLLADVIGIWKKKWNKGNHIFYPVLFLLVVPFLLVQANVIRKNISNSIGDSNLQKQIVQEIKSKYPEVPSRAIFYTESDKSYYGQIESEKLLPFQSGFGQLLMVMYAKQGSLSPKLLSNIDFLWNTLDQGYKEVDGNGFGYFRDYDKLVEAVVVNKIKSENIFAFAWRDDRLTDITEQIREKVGYGTDEEIVRSWVYGRNDKSHQAERWTYFDLKLESAPQKQQLIGAKKVGNYTDTLTTVQGFKHDGWVGASLVHYQLAEENKKQYTIPTDLYGYEVVNLGSVSVDDAALTQFDYYKKDGQWVIDLPEAVVAGKIIKFSMWAAVNQAELKLVEGKKLIDYQKKDIKNLIKTKVFSFKAKNNLDSFVFDAGAPIGSIARGPKGGYVIFVDGRPMDVSWGWSAAPKVMEIKTQNTIKTGQLVEIPAMIGF